MKGILVYFGIGIIFAWALELLWDKAEESGLEELTAVDRIVAILGWPIVLLCVAVILLFSGSGDDDLTPGGAH